MDDRKVSHQSCSAYWLSRHMTHGDDDGPTKQTGDRKLSDGDGECVEQEGLIVVDCRPTEAYNTAHICGAVNLSLPTLMTRRLARRQLAASTVISVIQQQQRRQRQPLTTDDWKRQTVVFYDDSTSVPVSTVSSCLVMMLTQQFNDDGHRSMILDGQ